MAQRVFPELSAGTYVIKEYDTLSSIARRMTGSADYSAIYAQNRELIGSNSNILPVGKTLILPAMIVKEDEE